MDKKYVINVTKSTVLNLKSKEEAETMAEVLANRQVQDFIGNLVYITTDIKELSNAS